MRGNGGGGSSGRGLEYGRSIVQWWWLMSRRSTLRLYWLAYLPSRSRYPGTVPAQASAVTIPNQQPNSIQRQAPADADVFAGLRNVPLFISLSSTVDKGVCISRVVYCKYTVPLQVDIDADDRATPSEYGQASMYWKRGSLVAHLVCPRDTRRVHVHAMYGK